MLNSLWAHIAIIDDKGVILEVNQAWRKYAIASSMPGSFSCLGTNYLTICDATRGGEAADASKVAAGIRAVVRGEMEAFLYDYPCHSQNDPHWYHMRAKFGLANQRMNLCSYLLSIS